MSITLASVPDDTVRHAGRHLRGAAACESPRVLQLAGMKAYRCLLDYYAYVRPVNLRIFPIHTGWHFL